MTRRRDKSMMFALRHPLRREILRTMMVAVEISPRELADELCEPLENTSYHVGVLRECNVIKLVDERSKRGAVQHFYRVDVEEPSALAVLLAVLNTPEDAGII